MQIGKRVRVTDIRELWRQETAFSTWLASPDGLEVISQDLGIDVEDARTECHSEDYRCDVVGHLAGREDHRVVIECQYGKTDHDHLGKLLTYASVHKATTGIWITERASGDHRQVIDWLNANTPETVNLYLCELRAYQIGESAAAPQLDVVCRPNEIVKTRPARDGEDAPRYDWRREFWTEITEHIRSIHPPFNLQKPSKDHWSSISIGKSGFSVAMHLLRNRRQITVDLYIDPKGWQDHAFQELLARREEVESTLGTALQWLPLPDRQSARIRWAVEIDPTADANRQAVKDWFRDHVPAFYSVFRPLIAELAPPSEALNGDLNHSDDQEEPESL